MERIFNRMTGWRYDLFCISALLIFIGFSLAIHELSHFIVGTMLGFELHFAIIPEYFVFGVAVDAHPLGYNWFHFYAFILAGGIGAFLATFPILNHIHPAFTFVSWIHLVYAFFEPMIGIEGIENINQFAILFYVTIITSVFTFLTVAKQQ